MALTVQPSDGFINRLLQQAHHASPKSTASSQPSSAGKDQVSISSQARNAGEAELASNHQLESKLMELYNQKGNTSF